MRVVKNAGVLLSLLLLSTSAISDEGPGFQGMSLQEAERLALQRDTLISSLEQKARAYNEQARASQSWPDPRINFGAQAVPVDTFDLDQEPMTQLVLGYQQMLPRGDSLDYASESQQAMARMQQAMLKRREREVLLQVRKAWLDVVLQSESIRIIQANRQLFIRMLDISQSYYASGRQQQQDVVQAELEISLVDDRLEQAYSDLIVARAGLAKWIGEENMRDELAFKPQELQLETVPDGQALNRALDNNPELIAAGENVVSQQKQLAMANEQYSPQWGFNINYGKRAGENMDGSERADFLSAMVTMDLPIFTDSKQDRTVAAARSRLQATRYEQVDVKRMLQQRLQQVTGRLQKLRDRHQLYQQKVLPQARQNAEVALNGYQSGVVSFFTLTRARVTELNTRLSNLRISIDYNKAYAELQYLIGEDV